MQTAGDMNFSNRIAPKLIVFCGISLLIWWLVLQFFFHGALGYQNLLWAASYQIIAIIGSVSGFIISKYWGGIKSLVGKSIFFLSLGLISQVFGQSVFSFYNLVLKVEIPYPSIADIGFFGSIVFYVYALFLLSKAIGIKLTLKSFLKKSLALTVPVLLVILSYLFFLQGYEFDWNYPLRIFLDFGYPLGDAIYLSLALITLFLTRDFLGGIMKWPILLILFALVAQYVADFNFLYQASQGTWVNGGYGDLLYMFSYFITALSLMRLGIAFKNIQNK